MKIRFEPQGRQRANSDRDLKVPYGPARRMAFKARWYLILLLVASPVLYFMHTIMSDTFSNEAPAMVWYPQKQLLARVPGFVDSLEVEAWDRFDKNTTLVRTHNPELSERATAIAEELAALEAQATREGRERGQELRQRRNLLATSIEAHRAQEQRLTRLMEQGAASRGELLTLQAELSRNEERLSELDGQIRRLPRGEEVSSWPESLQLRHHQLKRELADIRQQQGQLSIQAELAGVATEILVEPGQYVSEGTPLLRYSGSRLRIIAYVEPRKLERRLEVDREVRLILPDGSRHPARVRDTGGAAERLPAELRSALGSWQSTVPIIVEPDEPLPPLWRVDRMPIRVKF